jgi:transposase
MIRRQNKAEPYRTQIIDLCSRYRGNVHRVYMELIAQGAHLSYGALTSFVRRNRIGNPETDVPRSIAAAQQWLTELANNGSPSLELVCKETDNSSDLATLLNSMRNGRRIERKKAASILARKRGIPNAIVSVVLHSGRTTIRNWSKLYSEGGTSALFGSGSRPQHSTTRNGDFEKTQNLVEILHQRPMSFGVNRTGWTQAALIQAYNDTYGERISRSTLCRLIKNAGYGWKKARRVLTSPDPHYRDKVELLLKTVRSLAARELLFFLDEWGPVHVKKRSGRAYSAKDNIPRIPRHQVSRGTVALVAALSATTNQLTWAFVTSKDSRSMVGLLEILYNQYHTHSKLYVTWDAVSWHNSTALTEWLDDFNQTNRQLGGGPIIELVPLPTSAQFLNVIEGVLSGMTRAVINNSDYGSSDDMRVAISRHFAERNKHFVDSPRRAGKAIWDVDFFHGLDAFRNEDWQNDEHAGDISD